MGVYPGKDIEREATRATAREKGGALRASDEGASFRSHPRNQEANSSLDENAPQPELRGVERKLGLSSESAKREASLAPLAPAPHRKRQLPPRAVIADVAPESPADDAGFTPGCVITSVDGQPVRDMIDWRWLTADDVITLGYVDTDGDAGEVELERDEGEDWGFEFEGVVFDGVKQCRNACIFCFMRQLPDDMRPSLTLRDDDFRLSFLSGTFVTFTNLSVEDEARIVQQHISPLRLSLHASNPEVRRRIIGRHAQHGIDVLDRLLAAGIEFHVQIVLMPDENDGEVLVETLNWAYERPGIRDICIVPLGFTKHQTCFNKSFNDPAAALGAMNAIVPIQQRALAERGHLWAFAADEFYTNAYGPDTLKNLPPTSQYGDFGMFEDGVGIIRSFVDDFERACDAGLPQRAAAALRAANMRVRMISGCATEAFFGQLISGAGLDGVLAPMHVKNEFFGGNVDVTGLLCSCDIAAAVRADAAEHPGWTYAVPKIIFNDDGVTLDDATLEDMSKAAGVRLAVVSCNATEFLAELVELADATSRG